MKTQTKRRDFIKKAAAGVVGAGIALNANAKHSDKQNVFVPKRKSIAYHLNPNVALIKGADRKTNMYDALKLIEDDIKEIDW